jgi:lysophospholipase L1-like esterase
MSRHRRARQGAIRVATQIVVVLLLIGGVVGLAVRSFDRTERLQEQQPPPANNATAQSDPFFKPRPALLVVSDSMGGGVGDPEVPKNFPQFLADKMGWDVNVDGVGATGYLVTHLTKAVNKVDRTVPPIGSRLKWNAENYRADYIVVDVGRNDLGKNPDDLRRAIDEYLTQLRSYYPDATIFVVTPAYINPRSAVIYPLVVEQIRLSADKIGANVLDPIAEGWWRDVDLGPLLWRDGLHLNSAGAEYYAEKIAEGMRRAGVHANTDSLQGAAR